MSGIELLRKLRKLREGGAEVSVIFLTALSDQIYEEAALIGGAVDFVEKSRSFTILLKRIERNLSGPKAAARAPAPDAQSGLVDHGNLTLDTDANRADWKGRRVGLSRSEISIESYLVHRSGRDVGYRELYDLGRSGRFAAGAGWRDTAPTCARSSGVSVVSFAISTTTSKRSRIFPGSAIAGAA